LRICAKEVNDKFPLVLVSKINLITILVKFYFYFILF